MFQYLHRFFFLFIFFTLIHIKYNQKNFICVYKNRNIINLYKYNLLENIIDTHKSHNNINFVYILKHYFYISNVYTKHYYCESFLYKMLYYVYIKFLYYLNITINCNIHCKYLYLLIQSLVYTFKYLYFYSDLINAVNKLQKILIKIKNLPRAGFEPARKYFQAILSRLRLPIPPSRLYYISTI